MGRTIKLVRRNVALSISLRPRTMVSQRGPKGTKWNYGAVMCEMDIELAEWEVDEEATEKERERIRENRVNGARASFEEDRKGSIEPGKLADLVVLDTPLLSTDEEKIKDLQVDLTLVGGEVVYRRGGVDFGTR